MHQCTSHCQYAGAISCLEPFWTEAGHIPTELILSIVFTVILAPLCVAPTLESKRLVYSGWLSTGLYICWLVGIIYAHAEGSLNTDNVMVAQGKLFQDISEHIGRLLLSKVLIPVFFLPQHRSLLPSRPSQPSKFIKAWSACAGAVARKRKDISPFNPCPSLLHSWLRVSCSPSSFPRSSPTAIRTTR